MTREELLVALAARILALGEDRPRRVALDGMSCVGKTTLAAELSTVVAGAGRPVLPVSYDDFHHGRGVRHRRGRMSAEGYLEDSYDAAALRRLLLDPLAAGTRTVRTAAYDLAADEPVTRDAVDVPEDAVVVVEGEFLLDRTLADAWDLALLLIADPAAVLARALERDADLGTPEQVRELYLRRYLGAWSLHEERNDPWSRADVVVDLSDPDRPRLLG
ncbi:MAG: uridine kinase [Actinomycetes bacterium]